MNPIAQVRLDSPGTPDPALLLAAVEASPESLAVIDSGFVTYANPAWAQLFEYANPSQMLGRALDDFVPTHLLHTPISCRNAAGETSSGAARAEADFSLPRHDGTQAQIRLNCTGFRLRGRECQVLSAVETRPQKQTETEIGESQRLEAVGRLAGGVAHDFNNLLTGIMLYCDLLVAELEKDSLPQHHVHQIRKAGEDGAKVVQQLLAVARPQTPAPRGFALNAVITDIEELLTRLIGENIVLTTSLANDLGAVRMNSAQVQQILLNLVLNARDAMHDGGHITIATRNCANYLPNDFEARRQEREEEDSLLEVPQLEVPQLGAPQLEVPQNQPWVELTVYDTGCGMDNETLSRAFEPFFTTKDPGRGNGLGLSTARRLAKLEGGTIVAESQPGIGTRVSLLLPRVDDRFLNPANVLLPADSGSERLTPPDFDADKSRPKPLNTKAER